MKMTGTNDLTAGAESHQVAGDMLLVKKPAGWTSFDVVNRVRQIIGVKKAGHAGTLDPLATGLLIICTEKKTKELQQYQGLEKEYRVVMTLGGQTASFDAETPLLEQRGCEGIEEGMVRSTVEQFVGCQVQLPPIFSAVKVNGRRLYKYARKGQEVERTPREVFIKSIDVTRFALPEVCMTVVCSKGTYIRTLVNDIGTRLGCGAFVRSLERTRIGVFLLENAISLEELEHRVLPWAGTSS